MTSDALPVFDPRANVDAEIRHIRDDKLGRGPFARRIAERIADAAGRPSIVYGLAGPWGGGKSSVLNMVEELLAEERQADWRIVRFTPWAAADVDALTDEFYRAIAAAMPRDTDEGKRARRLLLAAAPVALAAGKAAAKGFIESKLGEGTLAEVAAAAAEALADEAGEITVDPDPFMDRFIKLSQAIEQAGQNILVIVDDIDRLHSDELLSVMKSVRLLGRFDYVHYFLSYDEDTLLDVLEGSDLARNDRGRGRQYLEKIVQYPFVLPPLDPFHFELEVSTTLEIVAGIHHLHLRQSSPGERGSIATVIDAIPDPEIEDLTPRFIYRFASQVDTLLTLVGSDEVNFVDAALLTYLRMRHFAIYKQLPRWRHIIVNESGSTGRGYDPSSREDWLGRIRGLLVVRGVTEGDKEARVEALVRLLGIMFPRAIQQSAPPIHGGKRISERDYFDRYFAYGIPPTDIPDAKVSEEFATLIESGALPSGSVIAESINSFIGRGLVRRKIMRNLNIGIWASSSQASEAANYLAEVLDPSDHEFGGWNIILYALLGHAISVAETDDEGRALVDQFHEKFGILTTTNVLSLPKIPLEVNHAKVVEASSSLRQEVLRICEEDLTGDVLAMHRPALTILHFLYYLDDDLWTQLQAIARRLLAEGIVLGAKVEPYELAARFVRIRESHDRLSVPPEEHLDSFSRIVPVEHWNIKDLPHVEESDILPGDSSLANRAKYAALVMRQMTDSRSPTSPTEPPKKVQAVQSTWSAAAPDESRPWVIEPIQGSANCNLRNTSVTQKYGVRMEGPMVRNPDIGDIDAYAVVEVETLRGVGGLSRDVVVTWHQRGDRSGEPSAWKSQLPRDVTEGYEWRERRLN